MGVPALPVGVDSAYIDVRHAQARTSPPYAMLTYRMTWMVRSHSSTKIGQWVIGSCVGRKPNACPPLAYKCISTGASASSVVLHWL